MDYNLEYSRWLTSVKDIELQKELQTMDEIAIEDAFYCDLAFGTGGLRGTIGAGTNRMNTYVVAKASQGLSRYLLDNARLGEECSVVIGYDSRIKSDLFARVAASVFAANGITVHFWPTLNPVPTVSFAVRHLHASEGVMITASHNPSKYNGYKVYGPDGCQITTEAAAEILAEIEKVDIFTDVKRMDFERAVAECKVQYIEDDVLTAYMTEVKNQSVLFGDPIDRDVAIVYSPLNGTGLIPVTKVLSESGFTNVTVVEEQRNPDGNFPTCPYPNPEIREAMELGLEYCKRSGADLLLATDPDADRCGIAVRDGVEYKLLSGNEVGILLLDYICSQRQKHSKLPKTPVFIKTIVTMDLAEAIATHYGLQTINVLTGFKYIGEQIGVLEEHNRTSDYIFGFEESYGYLTGSYVRDKDAVNAAFIIAEMFAYYKTQGITLLQKLDELYAIYGYSLNTLHSYEFPGSAGIEKMGQIMAGFHKGIQTIAGMKVVKSEDFLLGLYGLPASDVLKYYFIDNDTRTNEVVKAENCVSGSIVIRRSGTEPKLKAYISVTAANEEQARAVETKITVDLEKSFRR